ncbi:competence protein ComEC [Rhizocola hellebori]|uniref:Competence protein ComEC n=1 Tax=Rhizocola hellebori TaxID=1392758 RepID=A0A8J3Q3R5_9ACTN|nr:ComEC/Rec2 family competence protein [Rhizocola hellebori]GIH03121.1 competence protein ComEC [Rhizocola hellebori]
MDLRLAPTALGCWAAALTTLHLGWRAGLGLLGLALLAAGMVSRIRPGWRWIALASVAGALCGAAAVCAQLPARSDPEVARLVAQRGTESVMLTIRDDPRLAAQSVGQQRLWVVKATLDRPGSPRVVVLASHDGWRGLLPGQRVSASVRFGAARGADLTAAVLSTNSGATPIGEPPWIQRAAGRLRAGLQRACAPLPDRPGGLVPGLVIGDTSALDPVLEEEFRAAGLTHLVAVSGSNVAIVVGLVVLMARWARLGPGPAALVAALAVMGFVVLVRPSPSVLRAGLMGGIGLIALASGRRRAALPALSAAVIGLIVLDPELAGEAGFALSVLATGGLLLLAPPIRDRLRAKGFPAGVAEALAIPASAQLACAPVIAGLSASVSLVSVPANLLAVPAVAPATISGVAAAVISPVWPAAAEFLAWLSGWPAWWLVWVARSAAAVPAGAVPWPGGVGGGLLLAALTALLILGFRSRVVRRLVLVTGLAAMVGAVPVRLLAPGWPPPGWVMVVCDVGQGDAVVLNAGGGAVILVDTGPDPRALTECLADLDITSLPLVLLSHFHLDHIGGLSAALPYHPGQIVTGVWPEPAPGREAVHLAAAQAHIPIAEAPPHAVWTVGQVTLRVLATAPLHGTRSDPNNNSLVLFGQIRDVGIALLGDAETEQQRMLHADNPSLTADVVKVAHHGSAYQEPALLEAMRAKLAVVSVGAGNDYGHPNPALLAWWQRTGTRVMRTDLDGAIAVSAGTAGLQMSTK